MQKVIASHDKLYCTYSWSGWCLLVVWYHVVSIWDVIMMLMMRSSLQSQNHRRKLIHVRENRISNHQLDNPEILIMLGTQLTANKKQHRKLKWWLHEKPGKNHVLAKGKQFLLLIRHPSWKQNMILNDLIKRWCRQWEFCLSKNSIHLNYCHLQFIKIDNSLLELDVQYWCTTSTWCGCYGGTPWYISLLMAPLNVTIIQLDQYIL